MKNVINFKGVTDIDIDYEYKNENKTYKYLADKSSFKIIGNNSGIRFKTLKCLDDNVLYEFVVHCKDNKLAVKSDAFDNADKYYLLLEDGGNFISEDYNEKMIIYFSF